jgi:exonuclease SbcC
MEVTGCREALAGLGKDLEYSAVGSEQRLQQLAELEEQLTPLLVVLEGVAAAERQAQAAWLVEQGLAQLAELRQRIKAVDQLQGQVQGMQQQREQALARHTDLLRQVDAARHAGGIIEKEIRHLEEQAKDLTAQIDHCRHELQQQLQPLGISACPPHRADQLLAHLTARQQTWKTQQQHKEQLARDQAILLGERDKQDSLLAAIDTALTQRSAELEALRQEVVGMQEERSRLFGDRDPDQEEQKGKTLVQQAEAREVAARQQRTEIEKRLHGIAEQQRVGGETLAALLPQSRQQEEAFMARLPAAGFVDTASFCSALLLPEELAELGQLQTQLDKEQTSLTARMAEQSAALLREEEKNRGQAEVADLLEEQGACNQELAALQQRIGADRERLSNNSARKKEFAAQQLALAAQRKEQERWDLLDQLIGSADGKKFRVFAQGLTFDLMISHANRQLRKMNDRYILLRDPKEPLALHVIDNYQAGESRSTRNLSGGESFLVSLALSLGLSAMASHHVRVDSLFLDEGFGTLDEEALDTALQTLAELRQDGKLIGIISHVPLLRDRIDVRIQVLPGPGGCSRLVGPGCQESS